MMTALAIRAEFGVEVLHSNLLRRLSIHTPTLLAIAAACKAAASPTPNKLMSNVRPKGHAELPELSKLTYGFLENQDRLAQ